jgi:hypothetical protein
VYGMAIEYLVYRRRSGCLSPLAAIEILDMHTRRMLIAIQCVVCNSSCTWIANAVASCVALP